jgi:hypothetical protein
MIPIDTATGRQDGSPAHMSILDHSPSARLWWDGRRGCAVGPHGRRDLAERPDLGFRFVELDYSALCCQVRREAWHQVDDLTAGERDACVRYLWAVRPGPILPTPPTAATA